MEPIKIIVPIYIQVSKKINFALNLNQYRNAHFHTLNKAKVLFDEAVQPLLASLPIFKSLNLTFTLFFGSKREVDTSNVCCIVDKFFSDSLTHAGKIIDDNHKIIESIKYQFGGVDSKNPRVEVTIHDYEVIEPVKEEPVRIILVQTEIEAAIKAYVQTQISLKEGQSIQIDFKATRGDDGATAEINISNNRTPPAAPATSTPAVPGAQTPKAPAVPVTPGPATPKPATAPVAPQTATPAQEPEKEVAKAPEAPATETPETPAPVEKPAAPKSLFAGRGKPVNS